MEDTQVGTKTLLGTFLGLFPHQWWDSSDTVEIFHKAACEHERSQKIVTVYIAGPYTSDPDGNTKHAIAIADDLFGLGFIPFVPHLSHFWHARYPHTYERWMQWCCVWLERCDAVLRIPGESNGADDEVELANEFGIPVFYSVSGLWSAKEAEGELANSSAR